MRLIDADRLKMNIESAIINNPVFGNKLKELAKMLVLSGIDNAPTIDPVKHGKWIRDEAGVVRCSACKKEAYFILGTYDLFACCHHCGTRMDGEVMSNVKHSPLFNLDKTMEFNVVGDIKPVIRQILGEYEEWESSDCAVHLKGAPGISLPGYYPRMTYYSCFAKPKCRLIIARLYEEGLIELCWVRD